MNFLVQLLFKSLDLLSGCWRHPHLVLISHRRQLKTKLISIILDLSFERHNLIPYLLLQWIVFDGIHLIKVTLHLLMTNFILNHILDLTALNFHLHHPFDILMRSSLLDIGCYLRHSLPHIVDISLLVQVLLHFLPKFNNVSLGGQDLLYIADALILNFQGLVDPFERQLHDVLDICPFRICL